MLKRGHVHVSESLLACGGKVSDVHPSPLTRNRPALIVFIFERADERDRTYSIGESKESAHGGSGGRVEASRVLWC